MANALITIGSIELPEPSIYSANTATIVDSARNLQGVVVGTVIRNDVAKVDVSWRYLTVQQWASINKLFNISKGGKFYNTVKFFSQSDGEYVTRNMYVSDRSAGMWRRNPTTLEVMGWTNCKLALIEV